ncbi:pyridoxamine 5'-phosphate oxidase family protein [Leifsonia sp. 71-9]|uniref:pyridoxamine 5'-phosphate oxidase family protein n=1 Tax=Leifsonia sp. 71-9 TaxID=1895934 RepID=UPI000929D8DD|nr:pyridoxamine 5'-phosphate oxidase family protein [Leifsonia sp. 71-9]OJX73119.1 MAG: pyridoxamine 5-phosphate oxidase [Leifsonia sp. 71-9]
MPSDDVVRDLDRSESRELLRLGVLGRLATAAGGEPDIFPVNYYSDGETVLVRTAPGTKLLELTVHDTVAFEIDGFDNLQAWSVVVHGRAHELQSGAELDEAERFPLQPWIPTLKYRFVRISVDRISGKRFLRVPEPDRWPVPQEGSTS